jgi:hypothetical protein
MEKDGEVKESRRMSVIMDDGNGEYYGYSL